MGKVKYSERNRRVRIFTLILPFEGRDLSHLKHERSSLLIFHDKGAREEIASTKLLQNLFCFGS